MSKGKFRHPIRIRLSNLEVPYTDSAFVARIKAFDFWGRAEGIIPIAYFGYVDSGIFHVTSYSYSVQGLNKHTQTAYNSDPHHTAMLGLEMNGYVIKRR